LGVPALVGWWSMHGVLSMDGLGLVVLQVVCMGCGGWLDLHWS